MKYCLLYKTEGKEPLFIKESDNIQSVMDEVPHCQTGNDFCLIWEETETGTKLAGSLSAETTWQTWDWIDDERI